VYKRQNSHSDVVRLESWPGNSSLNRIGERLGGGLLLAGE